jgi:hypothetical protein
MTVPVAKRHGPAYYEPLTDLHPCDAGAAEHYTGENTIVMLASDSSCRQCCDCRWEASAGFAVQKMDELERMAAEEETERRPIGIAPWEASPERGCVAEAWGIGA